MSTKVFGHHYDLKVKDTENILKIIILILIRILGKRNKIYILKRPTLVLYFNRRSIFYLRSVECKRRFIISK